MLLYHWSLLEVATAILNDRAISHVKEFADVRAWATSLSAHFLRDSAANPFLVVEALFWRADKSAHAHVANHYGLVDGSVASTEAAYAAALESRRNKPKGELAE